MSETSTTPTAAERPRRSRAVAVWVATAVGSVLLVLAIGFRLQGGDWFVVETPSMGEAAPVGTLVLTAPIGTSTLRVGEIVSFHPPTEPAVTYTHRIAAIDPAGLISTKGDINGAVDGWRLHRSDLVGRVVAVLPGVGWAIKALPVLLGGTALVWWLSGMVQRRDLRTGLRFTGCSIVLTAALAWLRPLFGATALQVTSSAHEAHSLVVSTGLLPVRVSTPDGTHTDLVSGQVGSITAQVPAGGRYAFDIALALPWWGWLIVVAVCLAPTAASMLLARRPSLERP